MLEFGGSRETLKHPAGTAGWVARLCRSWLSPGKITRISYRRNLNGIHSCMHVWLIWPYYRLLRIVVTANPVLFVRCLGRTWRQFSTDKVITCSSFRPNWLVCNFMRRVLNIPDIFTVRICHLLFTCQSAKGFMWNRKSTAADESVLGGRKSIHFVLFTRIKPKVFITYGCDLGEFYVLCVYLLASW